MNNPILIHEVSAQQPSSPNTAATAAVAGAYRELGVEVIEIPANWPRFSDATKVLKSVARRPAPTVAILCGYIHSLEEYAELYAALQAKNLWLINSPEEYCRSHSFEAAYPFLRPWTPKTVVVHTVAGLDEALRSLGLPVFIKGAVQSRKDRGWKSCVAKSAREAKQIVESLLNSYTFSEGVAIIRQLVSLRHEQVQADGFPISREFRVILYRNEPVGMGYYWPVNDPLQAVARDEENAILELAVRASSKLNVPYVVLDIAQREDGKWIVVEPGDPQSAGFPNMDLKACFGSLIKRL